MTWEAQIAVAFLADLLFGDPRWFPHPVKAIGRFAMALEAPMRRTIPHARWAGVATAGIVVGTTALAAWALLETAGHALPWLRDAMSVLLLYTCFAGRDLADHAMAVSGALAHGDIGLARNRVARMVGRDTASLDEPGIVRATVESVAENTVDGVTAPLLFAFAGGPVLALAYKAVSTLDSTFGYKSQRYLYFGWASARLDDLLAWIPARITFPIIALAALVAGGNLRGAWRLGLRDCRKHASPNAGWSEAAFAGALGVQLGGPLSRRGRVIEMPEMGEPRESLQRRHVRRAVVLMALTSVLVAAMGFAVRKGIALL
jgi:adenosylcobinamide-phosphate synthase